MMILRILFLCGLVLFSSGSVLAQQTDSTLLEFVPSSARPYAVDRCTRSEWIPNYQRIAVHGKPYLVAARATSENASDTVEFIFNGAPRRLRFKVRDSVLSIKPLAFKGDTFSLVLPKSMESYDLEAMYKGQLVGKLRVVVYPKQWQKIVIVPLVSTELRTDSLERYLNAVYAQTKVSFGVQLTNPFQPEDFPGGLLSNPSPQHDRFTSEMIGIRDSYFGKHLPNDSYYIFLVDGFVNPAITGYMVRNKAVGFVKADDPELFHTIAQQLGYGTGALQETWLNGGPEKGTTDNLMDEGTGTRLNFAQWELIQRNINTIFYFDDYEDVRTNSGIIAYYFWEEDEAGNIVAFKGSFPQSILHPFKRNQYSLHLEIDNWLFVPLFSVFGFDICALHLLLLTLLLMVSMLLRRKSVEWLEKHMRVFRLFRWLLRAGFFSIAMLAYFYAFQLINRGYLLFEVKSGQLEYLQSSDVNRAVKLIRENVNTVRISEKEAGSEMLIRRGESWFLERANKVLYFDVRKEGGEWSVCRFAGSSDTLAVRRHEYKQPAASHYYVFRYMNEDGSCAMEKVYNHAGSEITDKLKIEDPVRRILLFVNGYRPTSLGRTFEENFEDIRKHGLEFPNSKNLIYDFDRYSYWDWGKSMQMTELFAQRINPTEVYFADGHFTVETSNHRSLLNFSTLSTEYPHRCPEGHHVCQKTTVKEWYFFSSKEVETANLLRMKPNKKGFEIRRTSGKVAGRNLEMMLNELPNLSANDTLFIVAHSMGYAYSLGIVDQLRGKINFGGFYIVAPENASSGAINPMEWKEVWQYGCDFQRYADDQPCLLDGIAPQVRVAGLPADQRVFIPEKYYNRMGFFDSHFIGYYNWIFDIPKNGSGYIRQR